LNLDRFPAGFLWGTATAAHQVEGGNHLNDWWDWEHQPGKIRGGDSSDPACDHYRRFREDFELLKSLHQNAHRLSIEWSRIEPAPGTFSREALDHYRSVLQALRERGMEPVVTLYHYTNPRWLAEAGGWEHPDTAEAFARFADRVLQELGELARFWVTFNEPTGVVYQGYILGTWPPGKRSFPIGSRVLLQILRGHWLAFERIKARRSEAQVGLAHHLRIFDSSRSWHPLDRAVAFLYQRVFNETLLRSLRRGRPVFPLSQSQGASGPAPSQDFFGLNYYTRNQVRFDARSRNELFGRRVNPPGALLSEQELEIYPEGLYRWLKALQRERLPIYITENGVQDSQDRLRPAFLVHHLRAALRALNEGIPLGGYFHWTCFDNFEWADGYSAKFGLMSCDPRTQERRLRASGRLFAEICRTGVLPGPGDVTPIAESLRGSRPAQESAAPGDPH
jgi:beta-glucosidase